MKIKNKVIPLSLVVICALNLQAKDTKDKDITSLEAITVIESASNITEGTNSYRIESTNSATRMNLSTKETPQSVSVVTSQQMEDMKLDTIADAINSVTGLTSNAIGGGRHGFSARGLE